MVPELRVRGHEAVAVDLPGADAFAGLSAYTERVVGAIGDHDGVVLVAQSLGGFTAAMACARVPVGLLVLVNAMIPLPGETPGQWWDNTGSEAARVAAAEAGGYPVQFDLDTYFLHDVPAEVAAAGAASSSAGPATSNGGRRCPHAFLRLPRIGSFPRGSSAGSPATVWGSPRTTSPAVIWSRCRARSNSSTG
ncbi:alpha/beta fold hydrolase [Streptomyces winkii]|uniref:alpha/beta fold hydrolase n=1 Tax=Streptomyces winkii TaxID=3051178 RepID=UPI0028D62CA8|nr:alpha/beta fold hydrolase [Streptomyces sp. DSM 40971]